MISIGKLEDFPEGRLTKVDLEDQSIVVLRRGNEVCAVANSCSHMPLPLANSKVEGDVITCPWHNSTFNICTGENIDWVRGLAGIKMPGWSRRLLALGREPNNLKTYRVVEENGELFVDMKAETAEA